MKRGKKTKRAKRPSLFIVVPLALISLFVIGATIYKIAEVILSNNSFNAFPRLEISLSEAPIEQINSADKSIKYPNNTVAITAEKKTTTYEDVEIKGRGNSTWAQFKKPYQIKFSEKTSFFDHKKARKWVLLANYLDASHLRNDIAFYLEHLLEMPHSLNGNFTEVYIDNNYYGLYYVAEKIEIDQNRINLTDPFGIIVELDNIHVANKGCSVRTTNGNCLIVHDTVNADNSDAAMIAFGTKINQLESAVAKKDYNTITSLIDIDSFAKYFLLNEFSNNPDAYSASFFMYQNGVNDKIHAGPGWDFDLALGSKSWIENGIDRDSFLSPFNTTSLKSYLSSPTEVPHTKTISTIIYSLMDIPEFEAKVKEIYQETLSGKDEKLLDYIKSQASYIRNAAYRDQERWKLKTDFDEEIDYLIDWVAKRYNHFEEAYGTILNLAPESQPLSEE